MSNDGSYESRNSELFMPDRMLMLDGVLQSRSKGEEAYHEALVHPVMFSHDNPKRVAIIGGGEGATLREVLKHNTVETAIMLEIDEIMVQVSKQYLPTWSDCSDIVGSTTSCFEDPRADVYYEDAIGWFLHRYGNDGEKAEPLDVIIMDALYVCLVLLFPIYDGDLTLSLLLSEIHRMKLNLQTPCIPMTILLVRFTLPWLMTVSW